MEHLINAPEVDNAFVQDTPIAEISPIVDDSSIIEHSSSVVLVQSSQHSVALVGPEGSPSMLKRYNEECNVAYAMSVTEEIEGNSEPSNYSEAITSADCNNWMTTMQDEMELKEWYLGFSKISQE